VERFLCAIVKQSMPAHCVSAWRMVHLRVSPLIHRVMHGEKCQSKHDTPCVVQRGSYYIHPSSASTDDGSKSLGQKNGIRSSGSRGG
jgi:hypothetical protein